MDAGRLQCGGDHYYLYYPFELDPSYNEPTTICSGEFRHRAYYVEY
jgi:hypothetical protein